MEISSVIQAWQYAASVVFVGALLGTLLYRITPPPNDAAFHFRRMMQAGLLSTLAGMKGFQLEEKFASAAGAVEIAAIARSLRRQRRRLYLLGFLLAAVGLLLAFLYAPILVIPNWLFAVCGIAGMYQTWKAW